MKKRRKKVVTVDYHVLWLEAQRRLKDVQRALEESEGRYNKVVPDLCRVMEEKEIKLVKENRALRDCIDRTKKRLASFLDADQLEACRITGCAPDEYAIQLIRLCKQKIAELSRLVTY